MNFLSQLDFLDQFVLAVFLVTAFIQLLYYGMIYLPVSGRKANTTEHHDICPVSVIICARDEQENLTANLPLILEQDYPDYEVIIVNDCSSDDTEVLLNVLKAKYPHLRSTIIKNNGTFTNGKKFAATVGIKAAKHEWLLFTDADCRPESPRWIHAMSRQFVDNKEIVLGYGGYVEQKSFLNKWIRYDTCFIALQYFGFALAGMSYMGVGRNLAYRKSLFFKHNGFAAHAHILSGDDDLFVNQAATKTNVAVEYSFESHTRSMPKQTWREWIWQKKRHISTGKYYKNKHSFGLALEPISRVLVWCTFCILIPQLIFWQYIAAIFFLRMCAYYITIILITKRFNESKLVPYAVLFDIAMPFVYLYVYLSNKISSKQNKWK